MSTDQKTVADAYTQYENWFHNLKPKDVVVIALKGGGRRLITVVDRIDTATGSRLVGVGIAGWIHWFAKDSISSELKYELLQPTEDVLADLDRYNVQVNVRESLASDRAWAMPVLMDINRRLEQAVIARPLQVASSGEQLPPTAPPAAS